MARIDTFGAKAALVGGKGQAIVFGTFASLCRRCPVVCRGFHGRIRNNHYEGLIRNGRIQNSGGLREM